MAPFSFGRIAGDVILASTQAGAFMHISSAELDVLVNGDPKQLPDERRAEFSSIGLLSKQSLFRSSLRFRASLLADRWAMAMRRQPYFIVVPTLRCDHSCHYCQVSRVHEAASGYDMSQETLGRAVAYILRHTAPTESVKVEFQGGEPLLRFDLVRSIVDAIRLARPNSQFVVCSALGPLTQELATEISALGIDLSVSVDGAANIHDLNRPRHGAGSWAGTMAGIELLRSTSTPSNVACVTTVTRPALDDVGGLLETIRSLNMNSVFVRPLSPFGFATKQIANLGYSASEFGRFYRRLLRSLVEINAEFDLVEEFTLIHLEKIFRPERSGYVDLQSPAGYLFGCQVVDFDGRVFGSDEARMLYRTTKSTSLPLLDLATTDEIDLEASVQILSNSFTSCAPGCEECVYEPFCGADPLHHLSTQGDPVGDKSKSFFCALQREVFGVLFDLLHNDPEATRMFDLWLNRNE